MSQKTLIIVTAVKTFQKIRFFGPTYRTVLFVSTCLQVTVCLCLSFPPFFLYIIVSLFFYLLFFIPICIHVSFFVSSYLSLSLILSSPHYFLRSF
jgi:hypothetical protein